MAALKCWICGERKHGRAGPNGTCGDCRAVLAAEQKCRSSARCEQRAGHGRWGLFCEAHAAEIAEFRARWMSKTGAVLAKPREPGKPEERATWKGTAEEKTPPQPVA